jgi:hypothetical protein
MQEYKTNGNLICLKGNIRSNANMVGIKEKNIPNIMRL